MPDIMVEVRGSWLDGKQTPFLKAVHEAVVQALKTLIDEPLARLIEHPSISYLTPHSAGERFARIEIVLFQGRSLETKRELYRAIVQNLGAFDVPPADVRVVLVEIPSENVGFRGGQAACDVDLGYALRPRVQPRMLGRGSRIRTCGLKYPKLPRYRAAPYPDGRGVANMAGPGEQGRFQSPAASRARAESKTSVTRRMSNTSRTFALPCCCNRARNSPSVATRRKAAAKAGMSLASTISPAPSAASAKPPTGVAINAQPVARASIADRATAIADDVRLAGFVFDPLQEPSPGVLAAATLKPQQRSNCAAGRAARPGCASRPSSPRRSGAAARVLRAAALCRGAPTM
jgi:hypothetical protein